MQSISVLQYFSISSLSYYHLTVVNLGELRFTLPAVNMLLSMVYFSVAKKLSLSTSVKRWSKQTSLSETYMDVGQLLAILLPDVSIGT